MPHSHFGSSMDSAVDFLRRMPDNDSTILLLLLGCSVPSAEVLMIFTSERFPRVDEWRDCLTRDCSADACFLIHLYRY